LKLEPLGAANHSRQSPVQGSPNLNGSDWIGHFAGRRELLLYSVDLEHQKADSGEDPQSVWNGS
jgi:hypothetical protein